MEKVTDAETGILWECTQCEKVMNHKHKLTSHIEVNLDGFTSICKCSICNKTHKTRTSLSVHVSFTHKNML